MAFYDYIVLDGYRYKTLAKQWRPSTFRAATPRFTLNGSMESTYGVGVFKRWQGVIAAPPGESAPGTADGTLYGNIFTLRASLTKTTNLAYKDHYGVSYSVTAQGPYEENSLINVWNSSSNKYYVSVQLTAKG